jgi:hypothetical protein
VLLCELRDADAVKACAATSWAFEELTLDAVNEPPLLDDPPPPPHPATSSEEHTDTAKVIFDVDAFKV